MPLWRCPHCGTPQAEAARCWVCRRSSTACASCRHFRRSVAARFGYCGLDRRRVPLRGDEIRACWESVAPVLVEPSRTGDAAPALNVDANGRRRDFVPVATVTSAGPLRRSRRMDPIEEPAPAEVAAREASEPRWSLWGEPET